MVSDKRLFEIMIKYHPTFIGWLIKNKKVEKLDDKLVLYTKKDSKPQYIQTYKGEDYLTNSDGSKRISGNRRDKNFTEIKLRQRKHYSDLITEGFDIFDIGNTCERYCLTSQIGKILEHYYNVLGDISFPTGFPRLKGEEALAYIKWMESKHDYLKKHDFKFGLYFISSWGYMGLSGFSDYQPEVIENIQKFGIFAYKPIYTQIEWTFDLVEKYKDQLVWKLLMDKSNLIWEEDKLTQYDKYIPFCIEGQETYCDMFKSEDVFDDYTKLGHLSNTFLESHKEKLNWGKVFEKCYFDWNGAELKHFCQFALSTDLPYSNSFRTTSAASQIEWSLTRLVDNSNFHWTSENLYAWLSLSDKNWKALVGEYRPNLYRLFLTIPNIKEIAEPHIKDIKDFWAIVCNHHNFPYDELTQEFTLENIKRNIDKWSVPLKDIFSTMRRTPDTNYYYYDVETQWDIYLNRKNIPLTYALAKFLIGINIKLGGGYVKSDGGYIEEDYRFPVFNGLEAFSNHHMASLQDTVKCIEDPPIADMLLRPENSANIDMITFITDSFFKDYDIKDYIDIINGLKNWDNIKEFYGDEE